MTRKTWLGERPIPKSEQYAGLFHRVFGDDIFIVVRMSEEIVDSDGDVVQETGWSVQASPAPDNSPRGSGPQSSFADDFDDVLDLAREWAQVAAKELKGRGVIQSARRRAQESWTQQSAEQQPRALSRVNTFVREDLPNVVEQSLRQAGADEESIAGSLTALREQSASTIEEAESADTMSRGFPEVFVRRVGTAIAGKVVDRTADLVLLAVAAEVGKFFGLF